MWLFTAWWQDYEAQRQGVRQTLEHVGHFPIVVVSPSDSDLISDSAEERRKYLNRFISQTDRQYLAAVIRYNQALQARNKLLKVNPSEEMLLIYDMMLDECAKTIFERRTKAVEQLLPLVERYYALLSSDRERIGMQYRSDLQEGTMADMLLASRRKDFINEHTTVGVHRDDVIFTISEYPLRKFGSQGQQNRSS